MAIQISRKGIKGRNKECWIGIPGSQAALTSASAIGTVLTVLSDGASGGAWTYELTETSLYFEISGADLRTTALVPVGTYYVQVKSTYGTDVAFRQYKIVVQV